jgi:tRNA(Ile)-lysidine synthase
MLEVGMKVAAAVSGGMDSSVMLHVLGSLKDELDLEIVVCHLDHGLRGEESGRDFEFVKALADRLGFAFEGGTLEPGTLQKRTGESPQAAAREARYEFLKKAAEKHGALKIALGHTMDDQAETVLMRFLKGSSTGGLSGMQAKKGMLIRPLIEVTRVEVEEFALAEGVPFVQDSSNLKAGYLRNDVRLNLIPFIKEKFNPNIIETLARTAAVIGHDEEYLSKEAFLYYDAALVKAAEDTISLDRRVLIKTPPALLTRVFLFSAWSLREGATLLSRHLEACLSAVSGPKPNTKVDLPGGLRLLREYESVRLTRRPAEEVKKFSVKLKVPGTTVIEDTDLTIMTILLDKPPENFGKDPFVAFFDFSTEKGPLVLRSKMPGDRIRPIGMKGHKKLKDVFIDLKVPESRRAKVPVLTSGDEVLWAVGVKQAESLKVTPESRKVLKVECIGPGGKVQLDG